MPTQAEIPEIVAEVKKRLKKAADQGVRLRVVDEKLEDGWLYIVVTPTESGVRASDHARIMSQVEREMRKKGFDRILLVPTIED